MMSETFRLPMRMRRGHPLTACAAVLVAAVFTWRCGSAPETVPADPSALSKGLAGRYEGTIPCPDCRGIRVDLRLGPEDLFVLSRTYVGVVEGDASRDAVVGLWTPPRDGGRLTLEGVGPPFHQLILKPDGSLGMVNDRGEEIVYDPNFRLVPGTADGSAGGAAPFRGLFAYMADAALFTECGTGRSFPVAMEGDYLALERAYLQAGETAGQAQLVTLDGRFDHRPKMEGEGRQVTLVVERFDGIWPEEDCGGGTPDAARAQP